MSLIPLFSHLPLTINEGIYSSIAQKMAHGGSLYLNAWDHKPPFIFLSYWLAGLLFNSVEGQAHLLAVLAHLADGMLVSAIAARLGASSKVRWFCGLFYLLLVTPPAFQSWSAQADLLMQPFLLMALFLAMGSERHAWFWSGIFWVAAFFFKQTALFYLPVFVYLSLGDSLMLLSIFFWRVNALTAAVVAPFALTGRLSLFWQAVMGANGGYVENGWAAFLSRPELRRQFLGLVWNGTNVYGLATLAIVGLYVAGSRKSPTKNDVRENLAPALFLACSVFACCVSGAFYSYYFVAVLPGLSLMVPTGLRFVASKPRWYLAVFMAMVIVPEMAAAIRFNGNPDLELEKAGYSLPRMEAARTVGEYLRLNSAPSDSLIVWASEPQIYSYSGLQFQGIRTPLVMHLSLIPAEAQKFELSLRFNPPDWIVVGRGSSTPPLPEYVSDVLAQRFQLVAEIGSKKIFRRGDSIEAPIQN